MREYTSAALSHPFVVLCSGCPRTLIGWLPFSLWEVGQQRKTQTDVGLGSRAPGRILGLPSRLTSLGPASLSVKWSIWAGWTLNSLLGFKLYDSHHITIKKVNCSNIYRRWDYNKAIKRKTLSSFPQEASDPQKSRRCGKRVISGGCCLCHMPHHHSTFTSNLACSPHTMAS